MTEFRAWPKTPRLFRDIVVTEKIDGMNACIIFEPVEPGEDVDRRPVSDFVHGDEDLTLYEIAVQSRKRLITPEDDSFGFARWVYDNSVQLFEILGPGRHYGEWWGKGIRRGYGMDYKVFSLFNTSRWPIGLDHMAIGDGALSLVPVLYKGPMTTSAVSHELSRLTSLGSVAAPGFDNPEGICVFHTQSRQVYKVTLDNNDKGKWESE